MHCTISLTDEKIHHESISTICWKPPYLIIYLIGNWNEQSFIVFDQYGTFIRKYTSVVSDKYIWYGDVLLYSSRSTTNKPKWTIQSIQGDSTVEYPSNDLDRFHFEDIYVIYDECSRPFLVNTQNLSRNIGFDAYDVIKPIRTVKLFRLDGNNGWKLEMIADCDGSFLVFSEVVVLNQHMYFISQSDMEIFPSLHSYDIVNKSMKVRSTCQMIQNDNMSFCSGGTFLIIYFSNSHYHQTLLYDPVSLNLLRAIPTNVSQCRLLGEFLFMYEEYGFDITILDLRKTGTSEMNSPMYRWCIFSNDRLIEIERDNTVSVYVARRTQFPFMLNSRLDQMANILVAFS